MNIVSVIIAGLAGLVFVIGALGWAFSGYVLHSTPAPMPLWERRRRHLRRTSPAHEFSRGLIAISLALILIAGALECVWLFLVGLFT